MSKKPTERVHDGILAVVGHGAGLEGEHLNAIVRCVTYVCAAAECGDRAAREPMLQLAQAFWPNMVASIEAQFAEDDGAPRK